MAKTMDSFSTSRNLFQRTIA